MSKIIDFYKKGNVVRLYCGKDDLTEWWGDDWNDYPYEDNAGTVYADYVESVYDIFVDYDYTVLEPSEDWHNHGNSRWCKEDMIARKVPCIVISKKDEYGCNDEFNALAMDDHSLKLYFGDDIKKAICHHSEIVHVKKMEK